MIKVISFDIGGTLLEGTENNPKKYALRKLTKIVNKPYENVRDVYKNVFQKSRGTLNELIEKFCKNLEISKTDDLTNFFIGKFYSNSVNDVISSKKINLINDLNDVEKRHLLYLDYLIFK